jgi:ureidoglycolate lyase
MTGRRVPIEALTVDGFAPFGSVLENPASSGAATAGVQANQGTAIKYADITVMENYYHHALSRKPSRVSVSMFICSPRQLRQDGGESLFDIKVLERHPYTTQTFVPLGLRRDSIEAQYLVIVAPTLPASVSSSRKNTWSRAKPYPPPQTETKGTAGESSVFEQGRQSPFDNETTQPSSSAWRIHAKTSLPKGSGIPDLGKIRVFLARGNQAVTYGAGTWHAPMIVVGTKAVEFVVTQFVNGVDIEDCQEIEVDGVRVDLKLALENLAKARL